MTSTKGRSMDDTTARQIFEHLKTQQPSMVEMVTRCALLESPSTVPSSQASMFELLTAQLQRLGFRCRHYSGRDTGGQLLAVPKNYRRGVAKQLLLGHCDTVWPQGTVDTMPVESRDGRLYGPGVYDMKGGLVQAIFALSALRDLELQPAVQPLFFINSDEEIGSPESAQRIMRIARIVDRVLVMEPSLGPAGLLKTSRKGVGRFQVNVTGRAAHAGLDPDKGVSAILEMSHVIQALHALNDHDRGTSVNVGMVNGGMNPNVIAPTCSAKVDVRVRTKQDVASIEQAIHSIKPNAAGIQIEITGRIGRPPLEPTPGNRKAWGRAVDAADALGIDIDEGAAGGGSDGNWTSQFAPTLDGLGAVGDGAHAITEHLVEDKMPERSALLACLLLGKPISHE